MGKPQIRLEKDVASMAAQLAAVSLRTLPREVNFHLREVLSAKVKELKKAK
jgi:hypothetical protein